MMLIVVVIVLVVVMVVVLLIFEVVKWQSWLAEPLLILYPGRYQPLWSAYAGNCGFLESCPLGHTRPQHRHGCYRCP